MTDNINVPNGINWISQSFSPSAYDLFPYNGPADPNHGFNQQASYFPPGNQYNSMYFGSNEPLEAEKSAKDIEVISEYQEIKSL